MNGVASILLLFDCGEVVHSSSVVVTKGGRPILFLALLPIDIYPSWLSTTRMLLFRLALLGERSSWESLFSS